MDGLLFVKVTPADAMLPASAPQVRPPSHFVLLLACVSCNHLARSISSTFRDTFLQTLGRGQFSLHLLTLSLLCRAQSLPAWKPELSSSDPFVVLQRNELACCTQRAALRAQLYA